MSNTLISKLNHKQNLEAQWASKLLANGTVTVSMVKISKEIKDIVERATSKADEGKTIASKMIHGYTSLNENVSKTMDLIKDVEGASKEQLAGIEQINNAINDLDKQTQQNAAVASQTRQVALSTQTIANMVVTNADEKNFLMEEVERANSTLIFVSHDPTLEPLFQRSINLKTINKAGLDS